MVKSFNVMELPIRAALFIPQTNWLAIGGDDHTVKVYNYNTMEKLEDKKVGSPLSGTHRLYQMSGCQCYHEVIAEWLRRP